MRDQPLALGPMIEKIALHIPLFEYLMFIHAVMLYGESMIRSIPLTTRDKIAFM